MRKHQAIAAGLLSALFLCSAPSLACMKAYGKTAQDALTAGFRLAERHDVSYKRGEASLSQVVVNILPEKEHGFFVAEVHSSAFCVSSLSVENPEDTDDIMLGIPDCKQRKKDLSHSVSVAVRRDGA